MIQGILWDRIGKLGPRFEICELHGERLHIYALQPGKNNRAEVDQRQTSDGILLNETGFRVRATILEHGTPVLAYGFEHAPELNIQKNRLAASGLTPGPWLQELKHTLLPLTEKP